MSRAFDGGYYHIKTDFIRAGLYRHTADYPECISDDTLEAASILGETGWKMDRFVGDLMLQVWESGGHLGGMPDPNPPCLPGPIPDDVWEQMTDQERREYRGKLSAIHEQAAKLVGVRESFMRKLEIYKELRDQPVFYFPHFIDFRTRLYPIPQDLHPQGDQFAKALLVFAEGKPLGPNGLKWLKLKLANAAGQDKLSIEDRLKWVDHHHREIVDSAFNPLDGYRFWANPDFDEPWAFLGTAREYAEATRLPNPAEYISHQPIPLDGSTNGLQHLAMMGRDPVGAQKTNCTSDPRRFDLYSEVAEKVQELVSKDAVEGDETAHAWISKGINRKTVKRAVMTTPYGVTDTGIRDQLIQDKIAVGMEVPQFVAATYMMRKIREAMADTIKSALEIMGWLQETARILAEVETEFTWPTPMGGRCVMAYHKLALKQVRTLMGSFKLWIDDKEMGLNVRKQFLSAAPNVIHSFDAAHLQKTVLRLNHEYGIESFAMIHDSFGTHAADTDLMSKVLREEAWGIYQHNWLEILHKAFLKLAPDGVELPDPPALGEYDPADVLGATYFFS